MGDDAALVAAYVRYAESLDAQRGRHGHTRADEHDEAAYETIHAVITNGPPQRAWTLVLAILRAVPDDKLGDYAVGSLESLVARWGDVLVDDIEREAARDEHFRWALGVITLTALGFSRTDAERQALARIVAASGGRTRVAEWLRPKEDESTSP